MDYASLLLFNLMQQKMRYAGERQAILAQNIANVDTPRYKAQDIKAPDFGKMVASASQKIEMARTNPAHMQGAKSGSGFYKVQEREHTFETNPNENTVSIEEEIQKLSMNQSSYQQATSLYRKTTDMFKVAIGRPGGA